MWMNAIQKTHPEWVEIITWNDFIEGPMSAQSTTQQNTFMRTIWEAAWRHRPL